MAVTSNFTFTSCARFSPAPEASADDAVMIEINKFTLRQIAPDEVAVFRVDLCNDQIDKHNSRFAPEELPKIAQMVVGKPLMERHAQTETLPRGTFFRAQMHQENGVTSVRPDVYLLRTADNEQFIRNIEGGVYRDISIGFSFGLPECSVCGKDIRNCNHVPGETYKGTRCHYIMRDVQDVIEGSIVASGSQGTKVVAQLRSADAALEEARKAPNAEANADAEGSTTSTDPATGTDESQRDRQKAEANNQMLRAAALILRS